MKYVKLFELFDEHIPLNGDVYFKHGEGEALDVILFDKKESATHSKGWMVGRKERGKITFSEPKEIEMVLPKLTKPNREELILIRKHLSKNPVS